MFYECMKAKNEAIKAGYVPKETDPMFNDEKYVATTENAKISLNNDSY